MQYIQTEQCKGEGQEVKQQKSDLETSESRRTTQKSDLQLSTHQVREQSVSEFSEIPIFFIVQKENVMLERRQKLRAKTF